MKRREIYNVSAPFNERTVIGRNPVGISRKREKERIKQKSKVFTVDIQIKFSVEFIYILRETNGGYMMRRGKGCSINSHINAWQ